LIFRKLQNDNDGRQPLRPHPTLYGTTFTGGAKSDTCTPNGPNVCGTVFKLTLPAQEDGYR
jgi:hypothetical protein